MTFISRWFMSAAVTMVMMSMFIATPLVAHGAGLLPEPTGKCPENYQNGTQADLSTPCKDGGERDYALDDIKSFLAIIGNTLLGVSGAIVLFCFVLGGFFWLASAGNEKMVSRGKTLISSAVIGLIIIFTAYTLVVFGVKELTGERAAEFIPAPQNSSTGGGAKAAGVIKGSISKPPSGMEPTAVCAAISGTCMSANKCTTAYSILGACASIGSSQQECCMEIDQGSQKTDCGKIGGTCQEESVTCAGAVVKGLCNGKGQGASVQCCIKTS